MVLVVKTRQKPRSLSLFPLQEDTYGIGIGEFVANPADKSPARVGGTVYPAGWVMLLVVTA